MTWYCLATRAQALAQVEDSGDGLDATTFSTSIAPNGMIPGTGSLTDEGNPVEPFSAQNGSGNDLPNRLLQAAPPVTSANQRFRLRGRLDTDLIRVDQTATNQAVFGDVPNSMGLRRARVGAEGNLDSVTRYIAEIDLATGVPVIRDLFVGRGVIDDTGEFRVGHFREPFSLEGGTSANTYALMERSSINDLDPARNWGLAYFRCSPAEDSTFAAGLFQAGTNSSDLQFGPGSSTALTAKWTALPWYEDDGRELVHVGIAISERYADSGLVTINQSPRSPLLGFDDSSNSPFVPSIRLSARSRQLFNAQFAYVSGPFSTQAEWYGTLIEQTAGQPVFYNGAYVNCSYFLTGEHRNYQTQAGVFGPVKVRNPVIHGFTSRDDFPERGMGAWELTSQLAWLDFADPDTPPGPQGQAVGVTLPQVTVGVNWYLADRLRLMFNYTWSRPDEPNVGPSSVSLFSSRLAMYW